MGTNYAFLTRNYQNKIYSLDKIDQRQFLPGKSYFSRTLLISPIEEGNLIDAYEGLDRDYMITRLYHNYCINTSLYFFICVLKLVTCGSFCMLNNLNYIT